MKKSNSKLRILALAVLLICVLIAGKTVIDRFPSGEVRNSIKNIEAVLEKNGYEKQSGSILSTVRNYSESTGEKAESLSEDEVRIEKLTVRTYRNRKDAALFKKDSANYVTVIELKNLTDSSEEIKNYTEMYSLMGYAGRRDESGIIVQTNGKRKESFLTFNTKGLIVTAHSDLKHESEILETLTEIMK